MGGVGPWEQHPGLFPRAKLVHGPSEEGALEPKHEVEKLESSARDSDWCRPASWCAAAVSQALPPRLSHR